MNSSRQAFGAESAPRSSPDPAGIVAAAGLTPEVAQVITTVVRATRLRRSERAEVARELCTHFADGIRAGVSPEQLIREFGEPRAASRLIARAVRRKRGWGYLTLRRAGQVIAGGLCLLLGVYAWYFIVFNFRQPNIARNYTAEFNARVTSLPESQRAWPVYRELLPDWAHLSEAEMADFARAAPGSPEYRVAIDHAKRNARALGVIREASRLPGFGARLSVKPDPVVETFLGKIERLPQVDARPRHLTDTDNPPMLMGWVREVTAVRHFARVLAADMHAAAIERDAARINQNAAAIFGLARQIREQRVLISDLIGCAIVTLADATVERILHENADVWSEQELIELAHILSAAPGPGDSFRVRFDTERDQFQDTLQRTFSDNGRGDGVLIAAAASFYNDAVVTASQAQALRPSAATMLAGPAASAMVAGRKELSQIYNSFLDRTDAIAATPLWQRTDDGMLDAEIEQLVSGSQVSRMRYLPLAILIPALGSQASTGEYIQQEHDAAIVAVALEIHRRRHGTYPASLSELVPTLLPAIPPDRYTGKPMNYQLRDGRPVLYSVGADRVDNGGVPPPGKHGNVLARRFRTVAQKDALLARLSAPNGPATEDFRGDWVLYPDPAP